MTAFDAAEAEVRRLEAKYSRYREDSLTARINASAGSGTPVALDDETEGLLNYADTLWQQSAGLFDLTAGVLRRAWNFRSGQPPRPEIIDELLPLVGWQQVQRHNNSLALPVTGMELDFGGMVKEYACDAAATVLKLHGVGHALVDLAGDMACTGPRSDGQPWTIAIRHPEAANRAVATVSLSSGGLATSGDYERYLEINGQRYGHILNPHTGWPERGYLAVSVTAAQCLVAGSAATVALLKSELDARRWLEELGLPWLAVDRELACTGSGLLTAP